MTEEPLSLDLLSEQEEGIVLYISAGKALITKLAAMGVAHGTRIKIARKAGSGPIILQSGETRFALGAGEAAKIIVQRLQPHPECLPEEPPAGRIIYVALTGQPNVGKSTIFNILTGLSQHVGNWPGKTVEKKEGHHLSNGTEMRITDLPGTYSLTSFSEEERITRDFIATSNPDVIVLLVNAAALERSLYLLAEMLLLGPPVIVALNMLDVAEAQGIHVDAKALEKSLGIPVVPMVATKNRGVRELVSRIIALEKGEENYYPNLPDISKDHSGVFEDLMTLIKPHLQLPGTARWLATKLMEGDPEISSIIEGLVPVDVWREVRDILIKHEDSLHAVVGGRYDWIEAITRASVSRFKMGEVVMTDRIDHILTRPILGIPILFGVFGLVFAATYKIGFPLQKGLEWAVGVLAEGLATVLGSMPAWFRGLLIDGVIGGAGSVLTFIPILLIFFAFMAILEDVGYMARAAFVMDRFMHLIGLHGKSFIPMCLGFGCNVPSILGARIVESKKEKLLTIFLSPFIPCTARLAVLAFIAAAIFGNLAMYISWGLLTANILLLGITGVIVSRVFLKGEPMPFIMELPLYQKPNYRTIGLVVWARTIAFVKRAGTVILGVSVVIWLLAHLPGGAIEDSILAQAGRLLEPIGNPIGLDWKMITALMTSIVAKENAVATLGVLYGTGQEGLVKVLPHAISHASALSFLVVMMIFVPCAATLTAMKQEMANRLWFTASIVLMLAVSFVMGLTVYHLALWTGF
jgi:ferrous iron transport protein B